MILDEIAEKTKIRYEEVKKAVPLDVIKEKAIQMNIYLNGFSFTLHYADSNSSFLIISSIRFSSIPATSAIWAIV